MFKQNKAFKSLLIALSLILAVTLVGCGKTAEPVQQTPAPVATPEPAPAPAPEKPKLKAEDVVLERAKDFAAARHAGQSYMIAAKDASEKIAAGNIFVLDVRSAEDFEKGHIAGAFNVSFVGGELATLLDRLPQDKEIYVLCYSGQQANQVNAALNVAGFNSKAITGGAGSWTKAELTLPETGANPLSAAPAASEPTTDADKLAWEKVEGYLGSVISAETSNFIAPAKLHEELTASADKYYVVDIRVPKADNYDQGHIEGSHFYSWEDMEKKMAEFPMDKKIVVGCWSGNNAGQAVALLRMNGYDAHLLTSGIDNGWLQKTKPEAERKPLPLVK
ncbi:hypothetical protein BHU72_04795 [Desulfuribacillus stibiiarsenatis]|uniref:Rhodanese domain-containing protein n=1 Tax=Desulfuribacillus stibiiarsenatis TaxID=1390249 RepID=A0A1E5L5M0_9FIRM|nr:rhodanese-like domain-containing protein [Desulfuribacillus stibiiarsenatis]OEH85411.1 hypothetical protein BHU72_04795 [Desulfuribacillus stibiiarsenatis]